MAQYVKIKKSKNLRFRLISLMYLIFLVLSAINIPIGWLKISANIHEYIKKPKVVFQDSALALISRQIITVDDNFKNALGYNEQTGRIPEPNSYSVTDKFFIDENNGQVMFKILDNIFQWSNQLPAADPRKGLFNTLFADDLKNGLSKGNENKWVKYRWKHMPAGLARSLMEEMHLRVKLLNSQVGIDETEGLENEVEEVKEPLFSLMTRFAYIRVGDEVTLSGKGDSLVKVSVERDGIESNDYQFSDNLIKFKPGVAGMYAIRVKGKHKSESMNIQVLPAGFPKKEALPFRICYTGIEYQQKVQLQNTRAQVFCDADPEASLNTQTGILNFRPNKEGWCTLQINSREGIMFKDSVFVKALPDPIFVVKGLPSLSISRKRLNQMGTLEIIAFHPSFKEGVFPIQSFQLRKVGANTNSGKVNGGLIQLKGENLENLKYLIIYDIEVKMGLENKKFDQPIIIQII